MTVKEYIDQGVEALLALYPKEEARALLNTVLTHFCHIPPHTCHTNPSRLLPSESLPDVHMALDDLCRARPIQYILGETLFEGCTIHVREGVLIPRPETAELVRWAQSAFLGAPPSSILDLCTGSGAIAIALAKSFPNASVYGTDISDEALTVAKENARINDVEVHFFKANILYTPNLYTPPPEPPLLPHSFDLIISNPPYVRTFEKAYMHPNVFRYEPHSALFVPDEDPLLFYRALMEWGTVLLKDSGLLMVEINEYMSEEIEKLLRSKEFSTIEIRKDICGKPRMCGAVRSSFPPKLPIL